VGASLARCNMAKLEPSVKISPQKRAPQGAALNLDQ